MKRKISVTKVHIRSAAGGLQRATWFRWPALLASSFLLTASCLAAPEDDNDGDGFIEAIDPDDNDPTNFSPYNFTSWYGAVFGDDDSDAIPNYWDYTPYNVDADGDGFYSNIDPDDNDATNFSPYNFIAWGAGVFGDDDLDGTYNYWDTTPYGDPPPIIDMDADGFASGVDPNDSDSTNWSTTNNTAWYGDVFGDNDSDGTANFWDSTPNGGAPDNDGDGLDSSIDPNDNDSQNWSPYNQRPWYNNGMGTSPLEDNDGDGISNYQDYLPDDSDNDNDGDTLVYGVDPNDNDGTNYSSANGQSWGPNALADNDMDGIANYYDSYPDGNPGMDYDSDGLVDNIDPAYGDATNYSIYNGVTWYSNPLGDDDTDGTQNFWDFTPYGE